MSSGVHLGVVDPFPFMPCIHYRLPGTLVLAILTMVTIGGAGLLNTLRFILSAPSTRAGLPGADEGPRGGGSVHLRRARAAEPARQERGTCGVTGDSAFRAISSVVARVAAGLLSRRTLWPECTPGSLNRPPSAFRALWSTVSPRWSGCRGRARHSCVA